MVEHLRIERVRKNRIARPDIPLRIPSARIANDLAPLIDSLPGKNGGELRIVGADGGYVRDARNGCVWAKALRRWVGEGLRVEYVLTNPSDAARKSLEKLAEDTKAAPGTLKIIALRASSGVDSASGSFADRFATFHPVLFRGSGSERAMWIEGSHRPGSTYAYDVTWAAPEAMRGRPDWMDAFEEHWRDIDSMVEARSGKRSR